MSTIITTRYNYADDVVAPFYRTLEKTGFAGRVVEVQPELHNGDILDNIRVSQYLNFLKSDKITISSDTIILTDIRDVVFQHDPLSISHSKLDLFLEDSRMTLGTCPYNSNWIYQGYGLEFLNKVYKRPISCAGVVIGTKEGVLFYLDWIVNELSDKRMQFHSAYQAAHNKFIYDHKDIKPINNEDGDVYTVGYNESIEVSKGIIYNKAGKTPAIIHQYDRHFPSW